MFSSDLSNPLSKIPIRRPDSVNISDNNRRWQSADCLTAEGKEHKIRSKIPGALQGRNPFKNLSKASLSRRFSLNLHSSQVNLVKHSKLPEGDMKNGAPDKVPVKKCDQAKIKALATSVKDKRSSDSMTVDSCNFRTSPTSEVPLLKNIIEEQENEILSLQAKLDSKIELNSHQVLNKQALLTKDCGDIGAFPGICNHSGFPYDHENQRGYSSLITINHPKKTDEMALRKENSLLKTELQEAKDHMELLEFRILEFTEDQKEYLQDCYKRLHDSSAYRDQQINSSQLKQFLELRDQFQKFCESEFPTDLGIKSAMEAISEISHFVPTKAEDRIESLSIINGDMEHEKRSDAKSTEIDVLSKLEALTKENKELHELIATLSESHETRTEASGTESELVHGKTPSISSDLSDAECDVLPNMRDTKSGFHNSSSMQESAIFESQCDISDAATQTIETNGGESNGPLCDNGCLDSISTSMDNGHIEGSTAFKQVSVAKESSQLSIEDISAVRIQDLQECDEYLLEDVDDRVILTKSEYDAIVAEERNLRVRIEELNADNDETTLKCAATEAELELVKSKTSTNDEKESMRGVVRALEEKLQSSEKHSKQFFEEKCEYEEAENDARLMVQRLQSQLEAAQEMEALLSASLSQEQEFSRELHNCVTDMQKTDIEEKLREEDYIREINRLLRREHDLASETELLKVHYFVLIFKVLVKEYFKQSRSPIRLEITNGEKSLKHHYQVSNQRFRAISQLEIVSRSPMELGCLVPQLDIAKSSDVSKGNIYLNEENIQGKMNNPKLNEVPMDCSDSYTNKDDKVAGLSDRERFYLHQIEILQHEKKILRNDFETNDGERYQQYVSCRNELDRTGNALEKSESEKCKLIFKIEELQYDLQSAKDSNEVCIQNLRMEYSSVYENLRREKLEITNRYDARLEDLKKARQNQNLKVEELKRMLTSIHLELAPYIDDVTRNSSEGDISSDLHHVTNLVKSEASLRDKIFELQEKERAYMETIAEADKIMSAHVTSYNKRIKELESKLNDKKSILTNLDEILQLMKEKMSVKSSCLESNEMEDFFSKLQSELRKLNLPLITNSNEGNFLDVVDGESNEDEKTLDFEFYEKEDLLQKLLKFTTQNSSLTSQLQEAHEATRKMSEMLQNEHYFRSRVEELESSESSLRDDLKKYENHMTQKERKYDDKVTLLSEEISSMKAEVEDAQREIKQAKNNESSAKSEMTEMKSLIQSLKSEVQESSDEKDCNDSQHRLEVARLRSQLTIANNQLVEIGGLNGDINEKFISSEQLLKEATKQLDEKSKRHEADVLSLNLKISHKESCIGDMEAHLQQLKHNEAAHELDGLSSLPFSDLHNTLKEVSNGIKECSKCSDDYSISLATLAEYSETFTHLINGRTGLSDSDSEGEKSKALNVTKSSLETENNLIEEDMDHGISQLADIYPCVPPRPRRDAKLTRKWKRGSAEEDSILEELQATMKNVRKNVSGKSKARDMKQKISVLENKVKSREHELQIADLEVTELYGKLATENETLQMKQIEISNIQNSMVTFRKEYLATVESNEKAKQDSEEKHKDEIEVMRNIAKEMKSQLSSSKQNTKEKSHLLTCLLEVIRTEICPQKLYDILSSFLKYANDTEIVAKDFTKESLRTELDGISKLIAPQPNESGVANSSEKKSESPGVDSESHSLQSKPVPIKSTDVESSANSRIPILKRQYILCLRDKLKARYRNNQCLRPNALNCSGTTNNRLPLENKQSIQKKHTLMDERTSITHRDIDRTMLAKQNGSRTQHEHKTVLSTANIKAVPRENIKEHLTDRKGNARSEDTKIGKTASIPSHCYMRSLKRAIPFLSAAQISKKLSPSRQSPSKNTQEQDQQCDVPRPQNLKITRRVGSDGVVIAWSPMENDCIAGFQVIVDGRVAQQVRSPKRTKALVTGLPFRDGFTIALSTVSTKGRCSIPATVTHKRQTVLKRKKQNNNFNCTKTTFRCFSP